MLINHTVESVEKITPTIIKLKLQRNHGQPMLAFEPGQYATISFKSGFRPTVERCFSIASSPTFQDSIEFGIKVYGKFTHAVEKLKPGDQVNVRGPFGSFVLDAPAQQNVVLCAGGIGITPFMSMIRYASSLGLSNKISLIYSIRSQDEAAYHDELVEMSRRNSNLRLFFVISDNIRDKIDPSIMVSEGRVTPEILIEACSRNFQNTSFFLCGPPPFMSAVKGMLQKFSTPNSNVITEEFNQGKQKGSGHGWPFNVYVLSAVSMAVAALLVMTQDVLKIIPKTSMPADLRDDQETTSLRQKDLESIINGLTEKLSAGGQSPSVTAAEKEVADALATIDGMDNQTSGNQSSSISNSTQPTTSNSSNNTSTTPSTPTTTPTPKPQPVCTTSASGVTTCN